MQKSVINACSGKRDVNDTSFDVFVALVMRLVITVVAKRDLMSVLT